MFCKYGKEKPGLRPCLADGKPAVFHRWADEDKALLHIDAFMRPRDQALIIQRFQEEGVTDTSATIEKLRTCFALVEYPDGSVGRMKPELIQFLDGERPPARDVDRCVCCGSGIPEGRQVCYACEGRA